MKRFVLFGIVILLATEAYSNDANAKERPLDGTTEIGNARVFPIDVFAVDVTVTKVHGPGSVRLKVNKVVRGFSYKNLDGYVCEVPNHKFEKGKRYLFMGAHARIRGPMGFVYLDFLTAWEIVKSDDGELQVDFEVTKGMPHFPEKDGMVNYEKMLSIADQFVRLQHKSVGPRHVFVADVTISKVEGNNHVQLKINKTIAGSFVDPKRNLRLRVYGQKFKKGKRYLFVGTREHSQGPRLHKDFTCLAAWEVLRSQEGELTVQYTALTDQGYSPFPKMDGMVRYEAIAEVAEKFVKAQREGKEPKMDR